MEKKTVYKYTLSNGGFSSFDLPKGAEFLSVKTQKETIVAYFLVDLPAVEDGELSVRHRFYVATTGLPIEMRQGMEYIDTVLLYDDEFVLHVFKAS